MLFKRVVFIVLIFPMAAGLWKPLVSADMEYIKSPKHTHVEKKYKTVGAA